MWRMLPGRMAVLSTGWLLCGCSLFSSDPVVVNHGRQLTLNFTATDSINPDDRGHTQPVRVCLYQAAQAGWMPEGVLMGSPCGQAGQRVAGITAWSAMLMPGTKQTFQLDIAAQQPGWIGVGAEFQQVNGALSWLELSVPAGENPAINILVNRSRIAAVIKTKE